MYKPGLGSAFPSYILCVSAFCSQRRAFLSPSLPHHFNFFIMHYNFAKLLIFSLQEDSISIHCWKNEQSCFFYSTAYRFELCHPHFLIWFTLRLKVRMIRKLAIIFQCRLCPKDKSNWLLGDLMTLFALEMCSLLFYQVYSL